jgi:hypothetical protein
MRLGRLAVLPTRIATLAVFLVFLALLALADAHGLLQH